jgi:primosomal protein N' (replication factor Y)
MAVSSATIGVAIPVLLDRGFTYLSEPRFGAIRPGTRVMVTFGSRILAGIVRPPQPILSESAKQGELKPILDVLDPLDDPVMPPDLVDLVEWMSEYYVAPIGEAYRVALPSALLALDEQELRLTAQGHDAMRRGELGPLLAGLGEAAQGESGQLLRMLGAARGDALPFRRAIASWGKRPGFWKSVAHAQSMGWCEMGWAEEGVVASRTEIHVRRTELLLGPCADEEALQKLVGRSKRRRALLDYLEQAPPGEWTALAELLGPFSRARELVRDLSEKALIEMTERPRELEPFAAESEVASRPLVPTPEQESVLAAIGSAVESGKYASFLLHGITGSGKTEVYLQAIARIVQAGGGAIVLVPEIALTPQVADRFRSRFGSAVAVLHSALTQRQRLDAWEQIRRGVRRIVIGARSAIFAPVPNLKMIIVDEEHDMSFKQDDGVRYNARDVALVRASRLQAIAILGSATPSLESYELALRGKHRLLKLRKRAAASTLPLVEILALSEHQQDKKTLLTGRLRDAIIHTVKRGEQAIIFLNRRGYNTILQCTSCGETMHCPDCSARGMTFHRQRNRMMCHLCGAMASVPQVCSACQSPSLEQKGAGTEKVEESIAEALEGIRVLRLDRDTSRGRALFDILGRFRAREADVLVGTQMLAKGHDFPGVTLVGVIAADQGLELPDPRAAERVFQLLTQVAGRAGRAQEPGKVLIQSWAADHPALSYAVRHDFEGFANEELRSRKDIGNPPFGHLAMVRVSGEQAGQVQARAQSLVQLLMAMQIETPTVGLDILGPVASPIEKVNTRYRWQLLLRGRDRPKLRTALAHLRPALGAEGRKECVTFATVDVDPYDFL